MARKRSRTEYSQRYLFWGIAAAAIVTSAYAFSSGYSIENNSQVAVGMAADMQCLGGADAKCQCGQGLKNGKCDASVKGGGKIGCPCEDITAEKVTSGKCVEVGKCKGEKTDGMMPMLPMLPMPMPKMPMPEMPAQPTCGSSTTTPASSVGVSSNAECPTAQGLLGGISNFLFGSNEGTGSASTTATSQNVGSKISNLLSSLLGTSPSSPLTTPTSPNTSSQGGTTQNGAGSSGTNVQTNPDLSNVAQISTGDSNTSQLSGSSRTSSGDGSASGGGAQNGAGSSFVSSDLSARAVAPHTFSSGSTFSETTALSSTLNTLSSALQSMLARVKNLF